jgi:hypothetical protein
MAFLDPKEELMKIILTDYGRKKLSSGDFKVVYYSFFDDEVDYEVSSGVSELSIAESLLAEEIYFTGSGMPIGVSLERSSIGTFRTHSSSLEIAIADEARFEDVGDSSGSALLIERASTNYALRSQELDDASVWEPVTACTATADVFIDPFGTSLAEKIEFINSSFSRIRQTPPAIVPDEYRVLSVWAMSSGANSPNNNIQIRIKDLEGNFLDVIASISEITWGRFDLAAFNATGTNLAPIIEPIKNTSGDAKNHYAFGTQLESGSYPTSYIITEAAAVTRAADVVYMTASNVYDWIGGENSGVVSARYRLRPVYSAGDLTGTISGSVIDYVRTIQSWGPDQRLVLYATASNCDVRYFSGSAILSSSNINFQRDQWFDVELNVNNDSVVLEVASASAGNGLWSNSTSSFDGFQSSSVTWLGSTTGSQDYFDGGIQKITKGRIANDQKAFGARVGLNSGYSAYGANLTMDAASSVSCSIAIVARADLLPGGGLERALCVGSFPTNGCSIQQTNTPLEPKFSFTFKDAADTTRSNLTNVMSQSLVYVIVGVLEGFSDGNVSASVYQNGVMVTEAVYTGYNYPDSGMHIGNTSGMSTRLGSWTMLSSYGTNNAALSSAEILAWTNSVTASLIIGEDFANMPSAKYAWNSRDLDPDNPNVWTDRIANLDAILTGTVSVVEIVPKVEYI